MSVKKHIAIFRQLPPTASEHEITRAQDDVHRAANFVGSYYKYYARENWDVEARGYVMFGTSNTSAPYYAKADVQKFMSSNDMDGFEPNYRQVWGGHSGSLCGQASLGGNWSVVYSGCGVSSMVHELGHSFGLHHASSARGEYSDSGSDMSNETQLHGINAPHLLQLGFESDREVRVVETTQQLLLTPIEMNKYGMHLNEYQHAIVSGLRGYKIYLSLRKSRGIPFPSGSRDKTALNVYSKESRGNTYRHGDIAVGETQELTNGVTVEYLEYKNETARVNIIYSASDPRPKDITISDKFPDMVPSAYLRSDHHEGAWHDPYHNRQGLQVYLRNGKLAVYWYTYQNDYSRRFYYSLVDYDGTNIPTFDLYTTIGGTWGDPTKAKSVKIGTGRLYFLNSSHGIFNYNTDEHGRGNIELTSVAGTPSKRSGSFWNPSRDGEGLTLNFYNEDSFCAAIWYTYTSRGGQQRWFEASGERNSGGTYMLTLYEYEGARFAYPDNAVKQSLVGTAILNVHDNNNLTFDFNLHSPSVSGKGKYNLKRLV